MGTSEHSAERLCHACSKLNIQRLTHSLHPCRKPLPCFTPHFEHILHVHLGSIGEIKGRRLTCDICELIAESLDKEPPDLDGECRILESEQFCRFNLPDNVEVRDPSITHFHFTQASVIFDTSMAERFSGPSLPWEIKERSTLASHCILNLQVSRNQESMDPMLTDQVKAKAKSSAEVGERTASTPETEQEFLDVIGGRHVPTQVNPQLVRAWLHQCENEHGKECMPSLQLPVERNKDPSFVIDVIESCVMDTPPECRYVALSYVWGKAAVFRHLLDNTKDVRKTGSLRSLPIPSTIRDAMTLVHAIGERYLWVDSLCIIQDDLQMQQTEITRMGSIYSRALFTIIAANGDHANSGLPGVKQGTREQVQKVLKLADCEFLTVIDYRQTSSGIVDTAWAQRAWTFQERILSNRVLVFSENQVYWSCRVAPQSEERAFEQVRDFHPLTQPFPQTPHTNSIPWERLKPLGYSKTYYELLFRYRERHLSYQTDILNAFNGISEILSVTQGDSFHWGHPSLLFSYSMTWFFTGQVGRNYLEIPVISSDGSQKKIPIPSWSWAAWSGQDPDYPPLFQAGDDQEHVRPVIQFDIVDVNHELVRIKERSWGDYSVNRVRALWKNERSREVPELPPMQRPVSRIGQLSFWTSFASLRTLRRWKLQKPRWVHYIPLPTAAVIPGNKSLYHAEIIDQDFIVIAARKPNELLLLAIEWQDGVAYRVGVADVSEEQWFGAENREWRLITLG